MTDLERAQKVLDSLHSKVADDAAAILWVRTNLSVMKLMVAWSKIKHEFKGGAGKVPKEEYDRWTWLWRCYSFSLREWLDLAGITQQSYGARLIDRIIKLRLVFPDGTYPQVVKEFLNIAALAKTTPEEKR